MSQILLNILATRFIPHGHCYLWKTPLVWLHVTSDALIALAYYSIPITLVYFVRKRTDLPYSSIFLLFGAFIISCGTTHLMEIWTLWYPHYWISGLIKAFTAFVSLFTAIELFPIVPKALALQSPAELEAANRILEHEISERKRIEEELRESEERFRLAFDNAPIGIVLAAPDGHYLKVNRSFCKILGYSEAELLTMDFQSISHPDDLKTDLSNVRRLLSGEISTYQLELRNYHKLGHIVWISLSVSLVRNSDGEPLYFIAQIKNITDRKQSEESLKQSEATLRSFYNSAPMMMGIVELVGDDIRHISDNHATAAFVGLPPERMKGRLASELGIPQENIRMWRDRYRESELTDNPVNFECVHITEKGAIDLSATVSLIAKQANGNFRFSYIVEDITERKQAKAHKEQEVLLQEIHHRVKNNLQVICSLLNLQSRSLKDPFILDLFRDSQNRVKSMALIHEKLYQSNNFSSINMAEYIHDLANNLLRSYASKNSNIKLKIEIQQNFSMDIDSAVPCGLIINELVTNSLKYAFNPASKGEISIQATCDREKNLILTIKDNGRGLPENFDLENTKTLGLKLVKNLINQLRAKLAIDSQSGTGTKFTIDLAPSKSIIYFTYN
ncbi:MAG: PAS domain S-box protein [Hydrococcus sp. Prado102]|jgi:PAS domain S-box-containing protein|nr:PAS domain S-box protein [Hydrococcus sp. Prado102]